MLLSMPLPMPLLMPVVEEGRLIKGSVAVSVAVVSSRCILRMIVVEIKMGACRYIGGAICQWWYLCEGLQLVLAFSLENP